MAGLFSSLKNLADGFFMEEEDTDDLPELERDKPVPAGAASQEYPPSGNRHHGPG